MSRDTVVEALAILGMLGMVIVIFFGIFGYYNYLHDAGMEQSCDTAFGKDATWEGNSADFNGDGIICETPSGELKQTEGGMLPMSATTYGSYLDHLAANLL